LRVAESDENMEGGFEKYITKASMSGSPIRPLSISTFSG
jgi:hypothetical protein